MNTKNFAAIIMIVASALLITAHAGQVPPVEGAFMDDFERTTLLAVAPAPITLSDNTVMYWNGAYGGTFNIVDGVLNADFAPSATAGSSYRFATNDVNAWKYIVLRIKGDARALNSQIYFRIGVAEKGQIDDTTMHQHTVKDILAPNGKALPAISSEFQYWVVDLAKNLDTLGGGSNAFQIGVWKPMLLSIDYIFMTDENPLDVAVKDSKIATITKSSQAKVWTNGTTIEIKTDGAISNGILSLYNLQGKLAKSFKVSGNAVHIDRGSLSNNTYLYNLCGSAGAILAKGKISVR